MSKRYILVSEKGWHSIRQLSLDLADRGSSSTVLIRGMADKAVRDMITKRREINNVFIPGKIFTPFLFMYVLVFYLTKNKNLNEAGKNLYKMLRIIKKMKYKKISVEKIPKKGLGITINDRLIRAAK